MRQTEQPPVIVVGAGLAGLACARHLARAGRPALVLEASDAPGGRVRTDATDGYLLDRGFQVLLAAYPEAQAELDYRALDLRPFYPGALVRYGGRFHRVADPRRRPLDAARSLFGPIGDWADKARVLRLVTGACAGTVDELFRRPETTTRIALRRLGFSGAMLGRLFEPFLGGIFLDRDLARTSRMLDFVIRMMAEGAIALPATGMGAIPRQLAAGLPEGTIRTGAPVAEVSGSGVRLEDGERIAASGVVVATEGDVAARLTGTPAPAFRSVACVYWSTPDPPVRGPYLMLDGEGEGPVNNLCVPSEVAPGYAPAGRALVSASILGDARDDDIALERAARAQLGRWFGTQVDGWTHLRTYRVRRAQPDQVPPTPTPDARPLRAAPGVYLAGDHVADASINGALASGRRAARALLADAG